MRKVVVVGVTSAALAIAVVGGLVGVAAAGTSQPSPSGTSGSTAVQPTTSGTTPTASGGPASTATYFNDASIPAADPFVLYDSKSGYYYAYSTIGADSGYHFGVYRSADLVTWAKASHGALPVNDRNQWADNWFWAPEVYYNQNTGLYFLFYAGRSDANAKKWFGYANFLQPTKIGVAVSRKPAGPFHNIARNPIDYNPYDPTYHDVNQLMGKAQSKPPARLAKGETAPLGTYIPAIDPDVFFADDGREYLYYSRNAYRDWQWDPMFGRYIDESNLQAVELTTNWWNDPRGRTMPTIAPAYRNANASPGGPRGPRRDGYVSILNYDQQPQSWENADVNDYALTRGRKADTRWEEGSTTFEYDGLYYLIYSANSWRGRYEVGYAVAFSPLGPWTKYPANPILGPNAKIGTFSPGHGSIALSPDGTQMYYVHHGTSHAGAGRMLYTDQMSIGTAGEDAFGDPIITIDQSTGNEPIPAGVAPFTITANQTALSLSTGSTVRLTWRVKSAPGATLALANPLNRVHVTVANAKVVALDTAASRTELRGLRPGTTKITLTYQRERARGGYVNVYNLDDGARRRLVSVTIPVSVTPRVSGTPRGPR